MNHTHLGQVSCSLFYMSFCLLFDFAQHSEDKTSKNLFNAFDCIFPLRPVSMHVMFTLLWKRPSFWSLGVGFHEFERGVHQRLPADRKFITKIYVYEFMQFWSVYRNKIFKNKFVNRTWVNKKNGNFVVWNIIY